MISFMAEVDRHPRRHVHRQGPHLHAGGGRRRGGGPPDGVLEQRPTVVNLQCDIDHPTQSMADLLHLVSESRRAWRSSRGKKIAMTWAYSPSYGKPLSVPQGVIGLFTRFGMDVRLAYPEGYALMPDVVEKARRSSPRRRAGASASARSMEEAFDGRGHRLPEELGAVLRHGGAHRPRGVRDQQKLEELEKRCLAEQRAVQGLGVHREAHGRRPRTARLYMHCLPADITGVSCGEGEVAADGLRPLPHAAVPAGQLEAVHHRGDDLPRQGEAPGGDAHAPAHRRPPAAFVAPIRPGPREVNAVPIGPVNDGLAWQWKKRRTSC